MLARKQFTFLRFLAPMKTLITVTFDGKVLRPDEPLDWELNKRYVVAIEPEVQQLSEDHQGWDAIEDLAGTVEAPTDWAIEHDHYLYGTPKRYLDSPE